MTLFDPILGRTAANFTHALPIDSSFIKLHAHQFLGSSVKEDEPSEDSWGPRLSFSTIWTIILVE